GVQQAVGADGAHVRDVDAEQRVEPGGQLDDPVGHRVGDVAGAVPVGHRHQRPLLDRAGAAGHDPADLHVTDAAHGVADRAAAVGEQAELGVPAAVQVGVDAFDVGQLRARGDAAVEGVHEQPALGDL